MVCVTFPVSAISLATALQRQGRKKNSCMLHCYGSQEISKVFVTHQARANQRGFSVFSLLQKGVAEKWRLWRQIAARTSELMVKLAVRTQASEIPAGTILKPVVFCYLCVWAYLSHIDEKYAECTIMVVTQTLCSSSDGVDGSKCDCRLQTFLNFLSKHI